MKEQITIRLFENADVPAVRDAGRYHPEPIKGWDIDTGVTIPLTEDGGGRVFGVIDKVDTQIHLDDQGQRYRLATVWIQD